MTCPSPHHRWTAGTFRLWSEWLRPPARLRIDSGNRSDRPARDRHGRQHGDWAGDRQSSCGRRRRRRDPLRQQPERSRGNCPSGRGAGSPRVLGASGLSRPTAAGKAVEAAVEALGAPIDILVNNAGSLIGRSAVDEMDEELWQEVIALNLSSVFFATKAALPHLGNGARIVNVSSIAARHGGGPGAFAYAAAKGGVMTLTRGLAKELASRNIRVNAIAPGVIETPFHDKFSTTELLETFRKGIPLGRLGTSEECAGAVLYLVSPLASYVTGQCIDIDGGMWLS